MRFLELDIANFMCYGEAQSLSLARRGLVCIIGDNKDAKKADSNGAGKSAIVEAVVWCLWGVTIRKLKSDRVINKSVKKNCVVTLYIEDGDKIYKITRTQGAKGKKANDLLVEVDGVPATAGTNVDTQELVDTIIGMDFQTFTQSVLLTYRGKSFCSMTDSELKAVLESILQIANIAKARDLVKARINIGQSHLAEQQSQLETLSIKKADIFTQSERLKQLATEQEAITARRRKELKDRRAGIKAQMADIKKEMNIKSIRQQLKSVDTDLTLVCKEILEYKEKYTQHIQALQNEKTYLEKELAVAVHQINSTQENSQRLSHMANVDCPTCLQKVTTNYVDAALLVYEDRLGQLGHIQTTCLHRLSELNQKALELKDLVEAHQGTLDVTKADLEARQRNLQVSLNQYDMCKQMLSQLENQLLDVDVEIKSLDNAMDPYKNILEELNSSLKKCEQDIVFTKEKVQALEYEVRHLLFWDHGFSNRGLKSYIIENAIPFLNERAQYYADVLSGGDLRIELSAQTQLKSGEMKEQLEIKVVNQQGAEAYEGNSDGEKRRSDIAVGWALGDLVAARSKKSVNFKCLDEPFENLDESGEEAVLRLLHTELPRYETVLVITHSSEFQDVLPNSISVVKEGGFARIVE